MLIAVDAMGGDFAPDAILEGAIQTLDTLPDGVGIALIGDEATIVNFLESKGVSTSLFKLVHAPDAIEMGEHPTKALQGKPNSSIAVGYGMLASKKIDAFCSAGNTGAMMVGAMLSVKVIPGVLRPAIIGFAPKFYDGMNIIVDVGANADCKLEHMIQFGEIGYLYSKYVIGVENPKVGLLNMGEEEGKGSSFLKETHQLLKTNPNINFVGNVEGRDIFLDKADVFITDGFVGNVVLKMAESFYDMYFERDGKADAFISKLNFEAFGGSPIIGINGNVIIGHGVSGPLSVVNMVRQSISLTKSDIKQHITRLYSEVEA
jgi:glycerol-3-phosphate acyltransferase PlsX